MYFYDETWFRLQRGMTFRLQHGMTELHLSSWLRSRRLADRRRPCMPAISATLRSWSSPTGLSRPPEVLGSWRARWPAMPRAGRPVLTVYVVDWTPDRMPLLGEGVARAAAKLGVDPVKPITLLGVAALGEPDLLVEVEATAVID
jgi:hypothetical protein